jgi:hypothetical protein
MAPPPTAAATGERAALELRLGELRQIFNSLDPAPFHRRDLDPAATDYIVDWAGEAPAGVPLALNLQLAGEPVGEAAPVGDAVRDYFKRRAVAKRRELSRLFRVGRISLVIGLLFLGAALAVGDALAGVVSKESTGWLLKESLVIGGWVALWRPIEIFLYDWWPLRGQAKLYDRLGEMQVNVSSGGGPAAA